MVVGESIGQPVIRQPFGRMLRRIAALNGKNLGHVPDQDMNSQAGIAVKPFLHQVAEGLRRRICTVSLDAYMRVEIPAEQENRPLCLLHCGLHGAKVGRAVDQHRNTTGIRDSPAGQACSQERCLVSVVFGHGSR